MEFRIPEFSLNKSITWSCHVDETTDPKFAQYDMIIGARKRYVVTTLCDIELPMYSLCCTFYCTFYVKWNPTIEL
jgi:hypothetical protein